MDVGDADDLAVAIGRVDVDDADAASRLEPVFLELGALAVAVLADGQHRAPLPDDLHRHDLAVVAERDAADAVRAAAHRADVLFVEAHRHPIPRTEEGLIPALRQPAGHHGAASPAARL